MKKALKITALVFAAAFIVAQFVRPDLSNPPIVPGQPIEDSAVVPADIQMLLSRSCTDCHSNKTVHPWYTQIAPVSWWLADHIGDGRRELNFSEWGTYSNKKKIHKLDELCEQVESGAMPLPSYLWMHDAALSGEQRSALCSWAKEVKQSIPTE